MRREGVHLKSAFSTGDGQDPRQVLLSQLEGTFFHMNDQSRLITGESSRLDGTEYEIDLSVEHARALRDALAPFVAASRRAVGSGTVI